MKNPFKKQGIVTTVISTMVGGAANVAADYIISNVEALAGVDAMYINGGKVLAGALIGSMSKNKYVHAAADGMAVVGASALIDSLINSTESGDTTSGLPRGTVGRVTAGDRYFQRRKSNGFTVSGAFMGK